MPTCKKAGRAPIPGFARRVSSARLICELYEIWINSSTMAKPASVLAVVLIAFSLGGAHAQQWPQYAADQAASHYSPLDQITPANVSKLAIAWEWKPNEKILPQF